MKSVLVITGIIAACLAGCLPRQQLEEAFARGFEAQVVGEGIESITTGSFSSAEQAAADPDYVDAQLHIARIWRDRVNLRDSDERAMIWVYIEQAAAAAPDKPCRQRIARLIAKETSGERWLVGEVYSLPGDAIVYAGAWREPARFDVLSENDLERERGCLIDLRFMGPASPEEVMLGGRGVSDGSTGSAGGATHATLEITISENELRIRDPGFDAAGNRVEGSACGPYVFKRTAVTR